MTSKTKYGFWFWSKKLDPILSMLSHLANYEISKDEREGIKIGLSETDDEKDIWFDYHIKGKVENIELKLAYDNEERSDMVHIQIQTSNELKEKIELLNLFQSMFSELIE
ncbi:MAG: hypothetical protein ABFS35_17295 [Bacteroidota bacterium]